jgi:hypothetical protein
MERLESQLTRIRNAVPDAATWDKTALGNLYCLLGQCLNDTRRAKQVKRAEEKSRDLRVIRPKG